MVSACSAALPGMLRALRREALRPAAAYARYATFFHQRAPALEIAVGHPPHAVTPYILSSIAFATIFRLRGRGYLPSRPAPSQPIKGTLLADTTYAKSTHYATQGYRLLLLFNAVAPP